MCWWWHFDRGNFDLTGPRLSHESKCVSQALEMEGRSLWLWHPCEGLRLLGVKCDTSLGRCWFSVATAQQTSSHGAWRGVWVRGWGALSTGQRMGGYCSSSAKPSSDSLQIMHLRRRHHPTPSLIFTLSLVFKHFFNHKGATCNCFLDIYKCVSESSFSFCLLKVGALVWSVFSPLSEPNTLWQNNFDLSPLIFWFEIVFCDVKITSDKLQLCSQLKCKLLFADFTNEQGSKHNICQLIPSSCALF